MSGLLAGTALRPDEAFSSLIEALRIAEDSAKTLAYVREQKAWLIVEAQLAAVREAVTLLATRGIH